MSIVFITDVKVKVRDQWPVSGDVRESDHVDFLFTGDGDTKFTSSSRLSLQVS